MPTEAEEKRKTYFSQTTEKKIKLRRKVSLGENSSSADSSSSSGLEMTEMCEIVTKSASGREISVFVALFLLKNRKLSLI
jgi:hypothetical protein